MVLAYLNIKVINQCLLIGFKNNTNVNNIKESKVIELINSQQFAQFKVHDFESSITEYSRSTKFIQISFKKADLNETEIDKRVFDQLQESKKRSSFISISLTKTVGQIYFKINDKQYYVYSFLETS